jgi:N-glycosylase/DNA lyase
MVVYMDYKIKSSNGNIIVQGIEDFSLKHTFECGQCFRWRKSDDGSYTGIVAGKKVSVSIHDKDLVIENCTKEEYENVWYDYFDLGTDYAAIKRCVSKDEYMKEAVKFGWGIRILKQEFWEVMISFIISANNHIPRIKNIIMQLSEIYGQKCVAQSKEYFSFPEAHLIASSTIDEVDRCRAGYRSKYIHKVSEYIKDNPISKELLQSEDSDIARKHLMKYPGIGPKVADCILLYSGTKFDIFPTDKWVKRVMEELYFKRQASMSEIHQFAKQYFGENAGYAQQYLFYYARENKIGV